MPPMTTYSTKCSSTIEICYSSGWLPGKRISSMTESKTSFWNIRFDLRPVACQEYPLVISFNLSFPELVNVPLVVRKQGRCHQICSHASVSHSFNAQYTRHFEESIHEDFKILRALEICLCPPGVISHPSPGRRVRVLTMGREVDTNLDENWDILPGRNDLFSTSMWGGPTPNVSRPGSGCFWKLEGPRRSIGFQLSRRIRRKFESLNDLSGKPVRFLSVNLRRIDSIEWVQRFGWIPRPTRCPVFELDSPW